MLYEVTGIVMMVLPLVMMILTSTVEGRMLVLSDNPVVLCPNSKFYNEETEKCQPCSRCPMNTIVRRPCHDTQDTVCDHIDLDMILAATENQTNNQLIAQRVEQAENARRRHDSTDASFINLGPNSEIGTNDKIRAHDRSNLRHNLSELHTEPGYLQYDWKTLALVVGGALFVVLAVLVVGVVCVREKLKRLQSSYKLAPPVEDV